MSRDVMDAAALDALRLKALRTNKPADRDAYFAAVSRRFQDRHTKGMAHEIAIAKLVAEAEARGRSAGIEFAVRWIESVPQVLPERQEIAAAIRRAAEEE